MNNLQMGGLWGSVRLELRPAAFLEHVFVQPIFDRSLQGAARYRSVTLNVSATLRGGSGGATPHLAVEVERWNSSAAVQLSREFQRYGGARDGDTISGLVTVHSPALWHPDATALYTATVRLVTGVEAVDVSRFFYYSGKVFLNLGSKYHTQAAEALTRCITVHCSSDALTRYRCCAP